MSVSRECDAPFFEKGRLAVNRNIPVQKNVYFSSGTFFLYDRGVRVNVTLSSRDAWLFLFIYLINGPSEVNNQREFLCGYFNFISLGAIFFL